jgi:hypothetical protein
MLQEISGPDCMHVERLSVVVNVLTWRTFANLLHHEVFCQLKYSSIEDITRNEMSL